MVGSGGAARRAVRGAGRGGAAGAKVPKGAHAVLRYTTGGIPHVKARTLRGAGFGIGYAQARDNLCVLADSYVTVNARRSLYFGPDDVLQRRQRVDVQQPQERLLLPADHRLRGDRADGQGTAADRPAARPAEAGQRLHARLQPLSGRRRRPRRIKDPACSGAAWVRPITPTDVYRRAYAATGLASFQFFTEALVDAQPPGPGSRCRSPRCRSRRACARRCPVRSACASLQRRRARPRVDGRQDRHDARQPALPLERQRALLGVPADRARQDRRARREPDGLPRRQHRPHPRRRVEPHRLDRLPLHAVRAHPGARRPDELHRRRPGQEDGDAGRQECRQGRRRARAHLLPDGVGADGLLPRRAALLDTGARLRARGRQRHQLPRRQHLLRDGAGAERRGAARGPGPLPGHPVGQHDRGRQRRQRLLRGPVRRPERAGQPRRRLRDVAGRAAPSSRSAGPAGPRRLAQRVRVEARRRRGRSRHPRAGQPAAARASRLRHQPQRLGLAEQPRAAADRVPADRRRPGDGAVAAHAAPP